MFEGGVLTPTAGAWSNDMPWGMAQPSFGSAIDLGMICTSNCDQGGGWTSWTTTSSTSRNVVWGTRCGGSDCTVPWLAVEASADEGDTVVWGTDDGDTVVWGTEDGDTVVWGTSCSDVSCAPVNWSRP